MTSLDSASSAAWTTDAPASSSRDAAADRGRCAGARRSGSGVPGRKVGRLDGTSSSTLSTERGRRAVGLCPSVRTSTPWSTRDAWPRTPSRTQRRSHGSGLRPRRWSPLSRDITVDVIATVVATYRVPNSEDPAAAVDAADGTGMPTGPPRTPTAPDRPLAHLPERAGASLMRPDGGVSWSGTLPEFGGLGPAAS